MAAGRTVLSWEVASGRERGVSLVVVFIESRHTLEYYLKRVKGACCHAEIKKSLRNSPIGLDLYFVKTFCDICRYCSFVFELLIVFFLKRICLRV